MYIKNFCLPRIILVAPRLVILVAGPVIINAVAAPIPIPSLSDNMRKELCIEAFEQACRRQKAYGMLFYSDRVSQYTSYEFRKVLKRYSALQSMSGTGRCYNNARMESFFATLKKETLYRVKTKNLTIKTVKSIVWQYIESYYNHHRIYTTNDGHPPLLKRKIYFQKLKVA